MSNRIQSYTEFSVEATGRFKIQKVVVSHEDQVVKLCEVEGIDDHFDYKKLKKDQKRFTLISQTKDQGLRMIELQSGNKDDPKLLMNQAMKINKSALQNPVDMCYLIASVIKFHSRKVKQELLEISPFDERLNKLS